MSNIKLLALDLDGTLLGPDSRVSRENARAVRLAQQKGVQLSLIHILRRAREELPPKVAYYAQRMGLQPTGMTITSARTRFGSCSPKNRLCFSWRLMDYPEAAIDYVVVHELAHIVHKNHGPQFWALVERYMPDYRARRALLRE